MLSHHSESSHVCTSRKARSVSTTTSRTPFVKSTAVIHGTRGGRHWTSRSRTHTFTRSTYGAITNSMRKARRCRTHKGGSSSTKKPCNKRGKCPCPIATYSQSMGCAGETTRWRTMSCDFDSVVIIGHWIEISYSAQGIGAVHVYRCTCTQTAFLLITDNCRPSMSVVWSDSATHWKLDPILKQVDSTEYTGPMLRGTQCRGSKLFCKC